MARSCSCIPAWGLVLVCICTEIQVEPKFNKFGVCSLYFIPEMDSSSQIYKWNTIATWWNTDLVTDPSVWHHYLLWLRLLRRIGSPLLNRHQMKSVPSKVQDLIKMRHY